MRPRSYNPLDYQSLSDTLARELMASELVPLVEVDEFYGDGVYALFYSGDFEPYADLADLNYACPGTLPIYIGKAGPQTLKGVALDAASVDAPEAGKRLFDRISKDHRKSIERAVNLEVEHFSCKLLVLNAVWVPLTESALIGRYAPIWNSVITGFGNHQQGSGRISGKPSRWDILHPGRKMNADGSADLSYDDLTQEATHAIRERMRLLGFA